MENKPCTNDWHWMFKTGTIEIEIMFPGGGDGPYAVVDIFFHLNLIP